MKIVMSLNTDPLKKVDSEKLFWSLHYLYLSATLASKHYEEVEFVTDTLGEKICNVLNMPFTNITVMDFSRVPYSLWAYSKLKAYELQKEPFIHIDNDLFLFRKLPEETNGCEITVEAFEHKGPSYNNYQELFSSETPDSYLKYSKDRKGYRMGIFGGTDIDFIREYSQKAISWCDSAKWDDIYPQSSIMTKVEQQLLYSEVQDQNKEVFVLVDNEWGYKEKKCIHLQTNKFTPIYDRTILRYFKTYLPTQYKNIQGKIKCLIRTITASDQNVNLM